MARLYGIGIGSGDPELMTLKAVRIINECEVIAVPSKDARNSMAYRIVREVISDIDKKDILAIDMPMIKDQALLEKVHNEGANQIISVLDSGKNVAFLTLGDPTVFSTYMYIHEIVNSRGYDTEIINGIASFLSVAARLNIRLSIGNEMIHIISSTYGVDEAMELSGTKVFMKVGRKLGEIKAKLQNTDKKVFFIENCGMDNEVVIDDMNHIPDEAGYYSIVIVQD